jgi:hypothetical protein
MSDLCRLIWYALIGLFRPRIALQAEILVLRHQLNLLRRKSPQRLAFANVDRLVFAGLYRLAPGVLDAELSCAPSSINCARASCVGLMKDNSNYTGRADLRHPALRLASP